MMTDWIQMMTKGTNWRFQRLPMLHHLLIGSVFAVKQSGLKVCYVLSVELNVNVNDVYLIVYIDVVILFP